MLFNISKSLFQFNYEVIKFLIEKNTNNSIFI